MDINMTLIGQSIAMIIFVWFCMKLIWPPIMNAIEERQTQIADGLAAAEHGQQSLGKAQVEAKEIVQEARKQATSIVDQAHTWANELTAQGKAEGMKERERQLLSARAELEQETNRVRDELRSQVATIAVTAAEKILQREIDDQAHKKILSKLAAQL